jgi:hypothetical protein
MLMRLGGILLAFAAAASAVIIAIAFGCLASYLALLAYLNAPLAALATAAIALLAALLLILIARSIIARVTHPKRRRGDWAIELGSLIGAEFAARAANHPGSTIFASLASGFALGASPELRQMLRDLLAKI